MRATLLFLLAGLPLRAAIDGTVINKTTSRPQPGVTVNLTELGPQGMAPGGSAKSDANGRFTIEGEAKNAHLLQAVHQGVTYNMQISPGATTAGIEVLVYDASPKPGASKVDQHMILLETNGQELVVNETLMYKNEGSTTWSDPSAGTIRFFVPPAAQDKMKVRATGPNGMPVERTPLKAPERNVYYLDYPIRPGETRFDVSYAMPVKDPVTFSGRVLHNDGKVRIVLPSGLTGEGKGLKSLGQEPSTKATIYEVDGRTYEIVLKGSGALRESSGAAAAEPAERGEEDGPRIEQIHPRIYDQLPWILGLSLGILAVGFYALYARGGRHKA